jgi:DnaJ family protein C protein 3
MKALGMRFTAWLFAFLLSLGLLSSVLTKHDDAFEASKQAAPSSPAELLKKGTLSLTLGKYADAIEFFDEAIKSEPDNYLSYYRRATAALSLGRSSSALADFDRIIVLNPKFPAAHLQRAKVLAKEGDLSLAKEALKEFLKLKKNDEEGTQLLTAVEAALSQIKALSKTKAEVDKARVAGKDSASDAKVAARLQECRRLATQILEVSPSLLEVRRSRAECALIDREIQDAVADWKRISMLSPSPSLTLRLASISYLIFGEREAGLADLKACLHSDPDNRKCAKAYRKFRMIEKALQKAKNFIEGESWRAALSALKGAKLGGPTILEDVEAAIVEDYAPAGDGQDSIIPQLLGDPVGQSALLLEIREMHCRAYTQLDEIKRAMVYCERVLEKDVDNIFARIARGEDHMAADRLEEAVQDLRKAFELSGNRDASIHARLQKAERKLKLSKSKDYYKVLGVARDADEKTLKKAYRKLAREHHPDKGGSPEKMAQINEAFDVLKNPELRQRFDAGDDPNDPSGGHQGGHGNPFAQGFSNQHFQFFQGGGGQQFFKSGGGGQQFQFHF